MPRKLLAAQPQHLRRFLLARPPRAHMPHDMNSKKFVLLNLRPVMQSPHQLLPCLHNDISQVHQDLLYRRKVQAPYQWSTDQERRRLHLHQIAMHQNVSSYLWAQKLMCLVILGAQLFCALQTSTTTARNKLQSHLATGFIDHFFTEHNCAFTFAFSCCCVSIQNCPRFVKLFLSW